jgi:hypothetical protein
MKFWKPGTAGPGSHLDRATEVEGNVVPSAPVYSSLSIQSQRERLPIFKHSMCFNYQLTREFILAYGRRQAPLLCREIWSNHSSGTDGVWEDYS